MGILVHINCLNKNPITIAIMKIIRIRISWILPLRAHKMRNSVWQTVSLLKWVIDVIHRAYLGLVYGQSWLYDLQQWLTKLTDIDKSESISFRIKWNVMIKKKIKYFQTILSFNQPFTDFWVQVTSSSFKQ